MKNIIFIVAIAAVGMGNTVLAGTENGSEKGSPAVASGSFTVNEMKSTLYWEGSKPGGKHHGTIEVLTGAATVEAGKIASGSFTIDMNSIRNEDISNEGMREKLLGHLKSSDFFYVEKYPLAYFRITGAEPGEGSEQVITGDLTVRGNTQRISFPAQITMDDGTIHARSGEILLDRTRWEVNHMSKSVFAELKDNFIDDDMVVRLDIHFNRQ